MNIQKVLLPELLEFDFKDTNDERGIDFLEIFENLEEPNLFTVELKQIDYKDNLDRNFDEFSFEQEINTKNFKEVERKQNYFDLKNDKNSFEIFNNESEIIKYEINECDSNKNKDITKNDYKSEEPIKNKENMFVKNCNNHSLLSDSLIKSFVVFEEQKEVCLEKSVTKNNTMPLSEYRLVQESKRPMEISFVHERHGNINLTIQNSYKNTIKAVFATTSDEIKQFINKNKNKINKIFEEDCLNATEIQIM